MDESHTMNRYARQMILPEMGTEGQDRLTNAHILVVGAGGLGVPVLQYLGGAGIGKITTVDPDIVSLSNLHRQVMYKERHVGLSKAAIAADIIRGLNREVELSAFRERVSPDNVQELLSGASLVLDCADSFAASYILSDACYENNIPLISASALAMSGYVGGFCGGAPSLRAVFPHLPDQAGSCDTAGVLGPVVGTIGTLQAQMALNTLLNIVPSPLGQLVRFDAKTVRFSNFRFDHAEEPEHGLLRFISPQMIGTYDYVVELRGEDEIECKIPNTSLQISIDEYDPEHHLPDPSRRAVFVCRSGIRAHKAATRLSQCWTGDIALIAAG